MYKILADFIFIVRVFYYGAKKKNRFFPGTSLEESGPFVGAIQESPDFMIRVFVGGGASTPLSLA